MSDRYAAEIEDVALATLCSAKLAADDKVAAALNETLIAVVGETIPLKAARVQS